MEMGQNKLPTSSILPVDGALVAVQWNAGFAVGRLQVRISARLLCTKVGKLVSAAAGKAKAGMTHSDCG